MKDLVILGAGTAGTMMANKLMRTLPSERWRITVVDQDERHIYQPGLLFVPFGTYKPEDIVRPRRRYLKAGIRLVVAEIDGINPDGRRISLRNGDNLSYDALIIATGTQIAPERTEGLTSSGWRENIFDFYTLEGASALSEKMDDFKAGTLVVNVAEMPIKCPVAPLEFLFLADAYFSQRGLRDDVRLIYVTPLDGAFTKPIAAAHLQNLLEKKGIEVIPEFSLESVTAEQRKLRAYDGQEVGYDLLVSVPLHVGSQPIIDSGLGDPMGFLPTHQNTLQSLAHDNIFCLGDATDLPSSKAGSVAHFQAEVLTKNFLRWTKGKPMREAFDGHSNCFIETGYEKALLIDFNYQTEPLPGRFPLPGIGPFTLLEESYVNHWGKLAFKWIYWNKLLPGEELPMGHEMLLAGKWKENVHHV